MFAVPGWSVSSSMLETQNVSLPNQAINERGPADGKSLRKRKRRSGKSKALEVNSTNLADIWETVIEGKPKRMNQDAAAERSQMTKDQEQPDIQERDIQEQRDVSLNGDVDSPIPKKKTKKGNSFKEPSRGRLGAGLQQIEDSNKNIKAPPESISTTSLPPRSVPQLTPLQESMRQKLISARFRHLNQTLYTSPSVHSLQLFQQNPEMFQEYHEGFRRQVEVWPENPIDGYIQQIKQRGMQRVSWRSKGKGDAGDNSRASVASPLPRTEGTCHIADLGCGDAGLSQGLRKYAKTLKLNIHSYDLQNPNPLVTKADIANLPLEDGSIDIAIFCLALMGTNWVDFVEEAFRILRWKGELWVAEIKSRFGRVNGKNQRVHHSVGNRQKSDPKISSMMRDEADNSDMIAEVDGREDRKQETDVSAFVEVLRKRGFELQSENAVNQSNRMFVKMYFVKSLTPIKGKCVPVPKGMISMGIDTWKVKQKARFLDDDEVPTASEGSVLKPCVYKLR